MPDLTTTADDAALYALECIAMRLMLLCKSAKRARAPEHRADLMRQAAFVARQYADAMAARAMGAQLALRGEPAAFAQPGANH